MLFRNNILEPVLSRTGSKCLGNSFYSKLSFYDICLESEKIKDALGKFSPLNEANCSRRPVDCEQQAEAAYQLLQGENPYSIVIEGAGPFLPFWRKKSLSQLIMFWRFCVEESSLLRMQICIFATAARDWWVFKGCFGLGRFHCKMLNRSRFKEWLKTKSLLLLMFLFQS